jgi:SPP1 gp7 family putative phage head morphogenesis protein
MKLMKTRKPTEIPAALKNIDVKSVLRRRGIYIKQLTNAELKQAAMPMAKQIVANRHKAAPVKPDNSQEQIRAYWEKQIHIVEAIEKKFENRVQQFISKMVDGFLAHLEQEIATTKSFNNIQKDYFSDNEDDLLTQAQFDFTPLLVDQAVLAGQEAYKYLGLSDVYTPEKLRKQIADNVEKFTKSMLDTDRESLINIISNGIENGQSMADIRGSIQASFDAIEKSQAMRITRTEVARASNQGALDAYKESGIVEAKQWVTFGAVDECADYDGQIETLSGDFYDDNSEFLDGDPPLHPNCRCIVVPIVTEKSYVAQYDKKAMRLRVKELEGQIDKRTKAFKLLQQERLDDELYIKQLEKHLGLDNE